MQMEAAIEHASWTTSKHSKNLASKATHTSVHTHTHTQGAERRCATALANSSEQKNTHTLR